MFKFSYRTYFYKGDNNYIRDKSFFYNNCQVEKRDINRYIEIFIYIQLIIKKSIRRYFRVR